MRSSVGELVNYVVGIVHDAWFFCCFAEQKMEDVEVGFDGFLRCMLESALGFLFVRIDRGSVRDLLVLFAEFDDDVVQELEDDSHGSDISKTSSAGDDG